MTAALALLLIGVVLIALGRRHRLEPAAPHLVGTGFIFLLFALLLFASRPAAADEQAGPQPQPEAYVIVKYSLLQQAAQLIEAQSAEIRRLRELLKQPKECI